MYEQHHSPGSGPSSSTGLRSRGHHPQNTLTWSSSVQHENYAQVPGKRSWAPDCHVARLACASYTHRYHLILRSHYQTRSCCSFSTKVCTQAVSSASFQLYLVQPGSHCKEETISNRKDVKKFQSQTSVRWPHFPSIIGSNEKDDRDLWRSHQNEPLVLGTRAVGTSVEDGPRPVGCAWKATLKATCARCSWGSAFQRTIGSENRRFTKVSVKERGSSMLFYNERLEPDRLPLVLVIQRRVTGDTGYGSRWYAMLRFGYSQGKNNKKVFVGQKETRNQGECNNAYIYKAFCVDRLVHSCYVHIRKTWLGSGVATFFCGCRKDERRYFAL